MQRSFTLKLFQATSKRVQATYKTKCDDMKRNAALRGELDPDGTDKYAILGLFHHFASVFDALTRF